MNEIHDQRVEALLGPDEGAAPSDWNRILTEFTASARKRGLVDVSYETHESPFGPLLIGSTSKGLVRVGLSAEDEKAVLEDLAARISPKILKGSRPQIKLARNQLDQYFSGKRRGFTVKLDWQLTQGFRRLVLDATESIPYGETRSYRDVATVAGSPKAVRAAGSALAHNPLPIVVPCHRVLKTDGQIGKYLGGTAMKEQLLEMEKTAV
ncbi:MAG: methylated-DNA--[protein]-cysteine S-methyltransferase [Solirubrobacterales bacterium]